jgi:hypothetical protein
VNRMQMFRFMFEHSIVAASEMRACRPEKLATRQSDNSAYISGMTGHMAMDNFPSGVFVAFAGHMNEHGSVIALLTQQTMHPIYVRDRHRRYARDCM